MSATLLAAGASPEIAATGLKNFTNALTRGESVTKRQSAVYDALGIDATKLAKRMQDDASGGIMSVLEAFQKIEPYRRSSLVGDLFGEEAKGALMPLIANMTMLKDAFAATADSAKLLGLMEAEYQSQAATTYAARQRLFEYLKGLSVVVGGMLLPMLNELMETIMPVIAQFTEWAAAHPELIQFMFKAALAIFTFRLASIALRWTLFSILPPFLHIIRAGSWLLILLPKLAAGLLALLSPMKLIRGALFAIKMAFLATGIGALIAGVAMAGIWIYNNWAGLQTFFKGFWTSFRDALGPAAPMLDEIIKYAISIWAWFTTILGPMEATEAQWLSWGKQAGEALGGVAGMVSQWAGENSELIKTIANLYVRFLALRLIWALPMSPIRAAGRLLAWVGTGPMKLLLSGVGLVSKAFIRLGALMLANPIGLILVSLAGLAWLVNKSWTDITAWITTKIDDVKAAFEVNLLNGVFKLLSEFNPFTLAVEGAHILITKIMELIGLPEKIVKAFKNLGPLGENGQPKPAPIQEVPGFAELPIAQQNAGQVVQSVSLAGELPTNAYMSELQQHAIALQTEIAAVQTRIDQLGNGPMAATLAVPMNEELAGLQEELTWVEGELVAAAQRADDLTQALKVINQTEVAPEIDTTSIDDALRKVARMSAQLSAIGTPRAINAAGINPQAARDLGGPVRAGLPYLVGERSPEIFVPGVSGSILPSRVLKAAVAATALAGPVAAEAQSYVSEAQIVESFDRRPSIAQSAPAPQITRQGDTFNITIAPPPGTDEQTIVRLLRRELERRQGARRADLHDGVDY